MPKKTESPVSLPPIKSGFIHFKRYLATLGPYLREEQCQPNLFFFDCLAVCASAKAPPEKREFWGWWLTLAQTEQQFNYHVHTGLFHVDGQWRNKPIPKKHQAEIDRTLRQFLLLLENKLAKQQATLAAAPQHTPTPELTSAEL
ncbi:MAG: sigma factor-binding protein Crl [Aeromonas sp.]